MARRAPDLTHARDVAQRALRLRQQTLDDERRQIVLKHNVLEVAVELHNRRIRATDWDQLARVLCENCAVEREHRKSQTEKGRVLAAVQGVQKRPPSPRLSLMVSNTF